MLLCFDAVGEDVEAGSAITSVLEDKNVLGPLPDLLTTDVMTTMDVREGAFEV